MKKHLLTFIIDLQLNGLYTLTVMNGSLVILEEKNHPYERAVERIKEIKEERDATSPGMDDAGSEKASE